MFREAPELEPLQREVIHERGGARVLEHPAHLAVEIGGEFFVPREAEQRVVRRGTPQEIREPRRELEFIERMRPGVLRLRVGFQAEDEFRRRQHRGDRPPQSVRPAFVVPHGVVHHRAQPPDFLLRAGPPPRPPDELREHLAHLLALRLVGGESHQRLVRWRACIERAFGFEKLHAQRRRLLPGGRFERGQRDPLDRRSPGDFQLDDLRALFVPRGDLRRFQNPAWRHRPERHAIELREFRGGRRLRDLRPRGEQRHAHRPIRRAFGVKFCAYPVFAFLREAHRRIQRPGENRFLARGVDRAEAVLRHGGRRGLAVFARHRALRRRSHAERDGLLRDPLRRVQIALHEHRRNREHIRDVVEPEAHLVAREIRRRFEIHAEQVANGVVVFRAIQSAHRGAAGVGRRAVRRGKDRLHRRDKRRALGRRWLRLVVRRHVARLHHLQHLAPLLACAQQRPIIAHRVQRQPRLLLLLSMAGNAVLFHKRHAPRRKRRDLRRRPRRTAREHKPPQKRGSAREAKVAADGHSGPVGKGAAVRD